MARGAVAMMTAVAVGVLASCGGDVRRRVGAGRRRRGLFGAGRLGEAADGLDIAARASRQTDDKVSAAMAAHQRRIAAPYDPRPDPRPGTVATELAAPPASATSGTGG